MKLRFPLESNRIRSGSLSHTFGMVRKNADGTPRAHQGWDFYAEAGTPCYAVAAGKVVFAGERGALGNLVVLQIVPELYVAYAHLSRIDVKKVQTESDDAQIGLTGNTGNAESMKGLDQHLHFEVRTEPLPGLGLSGRLSPMTIFNICPLSEAVKR